MIHHVALRAILGWMLLLLACHPGRLAAQCRCSPKVAQPAQEAAVKLYRQGRWHVAETANFQVCCGKPDAAEALAKLAEALRADLALKWFGDKSTKAWSPLCQVFLHVNRQDYVAAVGPGSAGTLGSSAVSFDAGQVTSRRIDLFAGDLACLTEALPHELTHVVLRDHFSHGTLPRWADEGMATLADTESKQARHVRDLQAALAEGREFLAADLLTTRDYPRSDRRLAFYGQSVFMTRLLVDRKGSQHFLRFLDRARAIGYDGALRECYDIAGATQLDRLWRRELYTSQSVAKDP